MYHLCSVNGLDQAEMVDSARKGGRAYIQEGPAKFLSVSSFPLSSLSLLSSLFSLTYPYSLTVPLPPLSRVSNLTTDIYSYLMTFSWWLNLLADRGTISSSVYSCAHQWFVYMTFTLHSMHIQRADCVHHRNVGCDGAAKGAYY